jgi:hypothetical protein
MLISTIIAPFDTPENHAPPPQPWPTLGPCLTDRERRLLAVVRESQHRKVTVWQAVNAVVDDLGPRTRRELRSLRVTLLCSLNRLLHQGLLRRVGRDFVKLVEVPDPVVPRVAQPNPAPPARGRVFQC